MVELYLFLAICVALTALRFYGEYRAVKKEDERRKAFYAEHFSTNNHNKKHKEETDYEN